MEREVEVFFLSSFRLRFLSQARSFVVRPSLVLAMPVGPAAAVVGAPAQPLRWLPAPRPV